MNFFGNPVKDGLPTKNGKYLVRTESTYGFGKMKTENFIYSVFNGTSFNVSNQVVTHWFNRVEKQPIKEVDMLTCKCNHDECCPTCLF